MDSKLESRIQFLIIESLSRHRRFFLVFFINFNFFKELPFLVYVTLQLHLIDPNYRYHLHLEGQLSQVLPLCIDPTWIESKNAYFFIWEETFSSLCLK